MKTVDYSNIALGMESSPTFTQQIQTGMIERFAAILKAFTNSSSEVVKVHGCEMTVVGAQYDQTAGVVFYNGELYTVPAFSGNDGTQVPVYALDPTYSGQAWYGDTVKRDTFLDRRMRLQFGVSGSGIADYDEAVLLEDKLSDFLAVQTKINNSISAFADFVAGQLDAKVNTSRSITAGAGLSGGGALSDDLEISVNVDNTTIEVSGDSLRVKDGSITPAKVSLNVFASERIAVVGDLDDLTDKAAIQIVTGDALNAPSATSADRFLVISNPSASPDGFNHYYHQTAIQVAGTGIGTIWHRLKIGIGGWSAWAVVNNPTA